MDFVKKDSASDRAEKAKRCTQITFDEDYNVPDARPDVRGG